LKTARNWGRIGIMGVMGNTDGSAPWVTPCDWCHM